MSTNKGGIFLCCVDIHGSSYGITCIHSLEKLIVITSKLQLGKLQSLVEYYFYATDGVPAKAVKPDKLNEGLSKHYKVFFQSTSQGSRCLKKGTKILYDSDDGQEFKAELIRSFVITLFAGD